MANSTKEFLAKKGSRSSIIHPILLTLPLLTGANEGSPLQCKNVIILGDFNLDQAKTNNRKHL
ncbi:Hypothetical protein FKW44_024482 [Caligus rogercresseyi]|uniref:Uncharacterized protein n=1 Tax=Caligus rogercresseyi TaxID=217165 RepID=A0A7T8GM93_CALRO|nr:Hypothetical protein FKW44_024813 [Caligus rogercresseyi]QQP33191.1 Hypothetical protein FKW44_024482 [Caligus rogercresseyi]